MRSCRLLGHRFRFWADDRTLRWMCERCGESHEKHYPTAEQAQRYARAFDREDREDVGKRAPLVGLFPLRMARAALERRKRPSQ
jgi:hypothetical protein